jgi:parallel beta-helix repeat protein
VLYSGVGINIRNSTNNVIEYNDAYYNDDAGIRLAQGSNGNYIYDNYVSDNNNDIGNGIDIGTSSNNNTVEDNDVYDNNVGIFLADSSNNTVADNDVDGNYNEGISVYSCDSTQILDNYVEYNYDEGIYVDSSDSILIQGNYIEDNDYEGIYVYSSSNIQILGNNMEDDCYESYVCREIFLYYTNNSIVRNNSLEGGEGYPKEGILVQNSGNNSILSNNVSDSDAGIRIRSGAGSSDDAGSNLVAGNIITDNNYGIEIKSNNNSIINNLILYTPVRGDGGGLGDYGIYVHQGVAETENNTMSGNDISGYDIGFYAVSITNFTFAENNIHDNAQGIVLVGCGFEADKKLPAESIIPLISDSNIHDNCEGAYLESSTVANITDTNFTGNNPAALEELCGDDTGLYVDSTSTAYVENGNFIDNGEYGIYDAGRPEPYVWWTISGDASLKNNNAEMFGDIIFNGGKLDISNATITINGTLINMTGNFSSLEINTTEITEGEDTDFNFTNAGGSGSNITLNLNDDVNTTLALTTADPETSPSAAPEIVTAIEIQVDETTEGDLNWALIKIYYDESEVLAAGLLESNLKIYFYNTTAVPAQWQLEPDQGVDEAENYVWANVTHLSLFGIFGKVVEEGGVGGAGGVGGTESKTASDAEFAAGYTATIGMSQMVTFNLNGAAHSVTLTAFTPTSATFVIQSSPQTVTMNVGEERNIDVDGDGANDLYIKLNSVKETSASASITVKKIAGAAAGTPAGENATGTGAGKAGAEKAPSALSNVRMMWILSIIGIAIVVFIIVSVASRKKRI